MLLVFTCCFFVQESFVHAQSLYVDPTVGSDSADGLLPVAKDASGPVKTINRAISLADPGDTVFLGGFLYKGSAKIERFNYRRRVTFFNRYSKRCGMAGG